MRKIAAAVAGCAAIGVVSLGSTSPAQAGGWCPPAYHVVYVYGPHCCVSSYPIVRYTKTTQYWPVPYKYRHGRWRVR